MPGSFAADQLHLQSRRRADREAAEMISIEDCVAMCGLDADEIAAIVEHEHVPEIEATAIASELLQREGGAAEIRKMLVDDLRAARQRGEHRHAAVLLATLRRFLHEHPEGALHPAG
jgi:hypothetical protein